MASSTTSENERKSNWFTRVFARHSGPFGSSSSTNRSNSISNPAFESFKDIMTPRRTTDQQSRQRSDTDQSLMSIKVNAESDVSSLADKSRGTIDFFHTSPVSQILSHSSHNSGANSLHRK